MSFGAVSIRHTSLICPLNTATTIRDSAVGGFLAITTGTVTLDAISGTGSVVNIFTALPVTAGQWTFIPFLLGSNGGTFTTAGGASGVLAV